MKVCIVDYGAGNVQSLDFALNRLANIVDKLIVSPAMMKSNMEKFGGIYDTQRILLYLTQKNFSRENAYKIIQRNAMKVWDSYDINKDSHGIQFKLDTNKKGDNFDENRLMYFLSRDSEISDVLSKKEIESLFETGVIDYYLSHVDTVFKRVFGED